MTDQLTYAPEELLASHDYVEPLVLLDGFHDLETPDPVIDEPAPAKVGAQPSY